VNYIDVLYFEPEAMVADVGKENFLKPRNVLKRITVSGDLYIFKRKILKADYQVFKKVCIIVPLN